MIVQRLDFLTLIAGLLILAGCRDYGEFTVADRKWVDNDELPELSEMDLTGINLEFAVGSEAHARVLPEVDWPDPVGMLMERVEFESGGSFPPDLGLPLKDGCMYVGLEPRYSRFRRLEIQGRVLLFVTYLVSLESSRKHESEGSRGTQFETRLAVIDESLGMKRYDFEFYSLEFQIVQTDTTFGVISTRSRSIQFRNLHYRDNALVMNEPVQLVSSGQQADKIAIATGRDGTFHIAWLTERYGDLRERFIYYASIDSEGINEVSRALLSDTATNRFLDSTAKCNQSKQNNDWIAEPRRYRTLAASCVEFSKR